MEFWEKPDWVTQSQRIAHSFKKHLGKPLAGVMDSDPDLEVAQKLWYANQVIVSHDTSEDPLLNYANQVALELWETDVQNLIGMPSRKTAEPMHRDERAKMLEETHQNGYYDNYQGIRISSKGTRFFIPKAIIWNLEDENGNPAGQAATFDSWKFL